MPLPYTSINFERFFARLAAAPRRLLLVGFDGTLAPFAVRPEDARPYAGIAALLEAIMQQPASRVVVVTGRNLERCAPQLGLARAPELWGAHGWQWRPPDGPLQALEPPREAKERLLIAASRAAPLVRWGARIESKNASVALHWRGLDALTVDAVRGALAHAWRGFALSRHLQLIEFDGGAELRARGRHKGTVVARVLSESAPGTLAAYLGDDLADEDAFGAMRGRGPGVLVRHAWRRTQATLWLRPPDGLTAFLERWRDAGATRH
jgi:trehalose-phosphatase